MKLNKVLLQKMIDQGYVAKKKHPKAELYIYNYTHKAQYEQIWNEVTVKTRGIILDKELNVIERPFEKFFNLEEHKAEDIPQLDFDVYEKLDGSLGILYWLDNKPYIATRGSFIGEQALHASEILHNKYKDSFKFLDKNKTYLFEIIYPKNRIVVNYGNFNDIILLAVIDKKSGEESIEEIVFKTVKKYTNFTHLDQLKLLNDENKEGFVIRYQNGFRVKYKFNEYIRLHRIIYGVSNRTIWKYLSTNKSLDSLLDKVPLNFQKWVKQIEKDLIQQYNKIYLECKSVYKELDSRKETALYFQKQKYPYVLFKILTNNNVGDAIWKLLYPEYKSFSNFDYPHKLEESS